MIYIRERRLITYYRLFLMIAILFPVLSIAQEHKVIRSELILKKTDTLLIRKKIRAGIKLKYTNPEQALQLLNEARQLSLQENEYGNAIDALFNMGIIYSNKGNYSKALVLYKEALDYAKKYTSNSRYMWGALNSIASVYFYQNIYDSATYYAVESMDHYSGSKIFLYKNFAMLWAAMDQYDRALEYLEEAQKMILANPSAAKKEMETQIDVGLAVVYLNKGEWDKGRYYAYKVIDNKNSYPSSITVANTTIGCSYLFQDKPEAGKAIYYFKKALNSPGINPRHSFIDPNINLGKAYALLKDYKRAEWHFLIALDTMKKLGLSLDPYLSVYSDLAKLYHNMAEDAKAYQYQKTYSNLRDSGIAEEKTKTIHEIEAKYLLSEKDRELTKKELLLTRQQAEIRNKNLWIGSISASALLLGSFFVLIVYNTRRRQRLKREILQLQSIMQGEEKERTRLAHELHDGIVIQFSAVKMNLSTLPNHHADLADSTDYKAIIQSLDDATKELRKTAHKLMPDMLLEDGLAEATFYFCKSLMQNATLEIDFQHYGDLPRLDPDFELSVYRIIQELVQNIIKHAEATQAMVQLSYHEKQLNITVEDNGKGFDTTDPQLAAGMGLRSIRARVKALNGHLDLQSTPGKGTIAYLEFMCDAGDKT